MKANRRLTVPGYHEVSPGARSNDQLENTREALKGVEDTISGKLNGKREVVHYKAPSKDRLSLIDQEVVDENRSIIRSEHVKKTSNEPKNSVAQRLHGLEKEKLSKLERIRQKKIEEEMSQIKDKPAIVQYEFTRDRIPLHLQSKMKPDFDEQMKKYRSLNHTQVEDDGTEPGAYTPNKKACLTRKAEDLMTWKEKKSLHLATQRLTQDQDELTFSPKLNRKSLEMVVLHQSRSRIDLVVV